MEYDRACVEIQFGSCCRTIVSVSQPTSTPHFSFWSCVSLLTSLCHRHTWGINKCYTHNYLDRSSQRHLVMHVVFYCSFVTCSSRLDKSDKSCSRCSCILDVCSPCKLIVGSSFVVVLGIGRLVCFSHIWYTSCSCVRTPMLVIGYMIYPVMKSVALSIPFDFDTLNLLFVRSWLPL